MTEAGPNIIGVKKCWYLPIRSRQGDRTWQSAALCRELWWERKNQRRFLAGSHSGWGGRALQPRGCTQRSVGLNTKAGGPEAKHDLFNLGCLICTDLEENNRRPLKGDKHPSHQTRQFIWNICSVPAHSRCTSLPLVHDLRQGEAQWGRGEAAGGHGCAHSGAGGGRSASTEESGHTPSLTTAPWARCHLSPASHARSESTDSRGHRLSLFCLQERKLSFTCIESNGSRINQTELSSKQGKYRDLILGAFSRTETQTWDSPASRREGSRDGRGYPGHRCGMRQYPWTICRAPVHRRGTNLLPVCDPQRQGGAQWWPPQTRQRPAAKEGPSRLKMSGQRQRERRPLDK